MDAYSIAVQQVKKEYKEEMAQAQLDARKRMNIRLRSLEKAFGGKRGRGATVRGWTSVKNFSKGSYSDLVIAEIEKMTPGTKFSVRELHGMVHRNNKEARIGSCNSLLSNFKIGRHTESPVYEKLRSLIQVSGQKVDSASGPKTMLFERI